MKKLFSWLIQPIVLSLIGVLLLSLVIWFEAPLLSFDGAAPFASSGLRATLIWLLIALWAGYFGWRRLQAWLANRRLMRTVAGQDAKPEPDALAGAESAAEVALLATRMEQAMAQLRKSRAATAAGGLYRLPWYMFVGAPGSGKTTALVHSGLNFPLADTHGKGAVGGVGGTRNCDWWFTDEAVLLDTAGRYTTQDSHGERDQAAWDGFLRLLRKARGRRPINGVIVALSVADLLQQDDLARRAQALAVRARIQELHERLGIVFPVYVVVTKCDLLAGFVEYFDNLGREERAQVWGMTFPLAPAAERDAGLRQFGAEFAALEARLQGRLFERMQQERDVQRRALIYNFPQQFGAIGAALRDFLDDALGATDYEEAALVRGVYFTSGTQEGSPIDRVMSALAASFGLERKVLPVNAFGGRSYFITGLMREVIFQEAGLAGANIKLERNRRALQWAVVGLSAALLVFGAIGLAGSYVRNQAYLQDVATRVAEVDRLARALPPAQDSPLVTLELLGALRDIPPGYGAPGQSAPWTMRFGLYQGDRVGERAAAAYRRLLRAALLPRVLGRLQTELRRGTVNSSDYLYESLRVYLMLGQPAHLDPAAVAAWVERDAARNLPGASATELAALNGHVLALLDPAAAAADADAAPTLDQGLVEQTRLSLAKMALSERIYNGIQRVVAGANLAEFDVASAAGRDAAQVLVRDSGEPLTRGVPGLYTVAGHLAVQAAIDPAIAELVKENWVLDRREAIDGLAAAAQMRAAVQQLYYEDYIRRWDALLADVALAPLDGLDQASRVLTLLSGPNSPMRLFLRAAARQTSLDAVRAPKSGVDLASDKVKQLGDAAKQRIEAALAGPGAPAAAVAAAAAIPANPVDAHFVALHKMVAAGANGSALDQLLQKLKDVAVYFDAAGAARAAGLPAPPADALDKLRREAAGGLPAPLAGVLEAIDVNGAGLTLENERARLNALWQAGPASFCKRAIAGRYPVARGAAREITADDFGRYYGPGGLVDDFFQKQLASRVDTGGARWQWRVAGEAGLGIGQDALDEFQRAAAIRDQFFGPGARNPALRFDLRVLSADAGLSKVVVELDGQALSYAPNAVNLPASFQLPSGKGVGLARIALSPSFVDDFRTEGPWAWFRMIDRGSLRATPQGERFELGFNIDGTRLRLEITANSVNNPFPREALERSRCLEQL